MEFQLVLTDVGEPVHADRGSSVDPPPGETEAVFAQGSARVHPSKRLDGPRTEEKAPRGRMLELCMVMLWITASLDVNTTLREVLDSVRELTNAHYGVITIFEGTNNIQDFVTSSITSEECRGTANWTDGPQLLEHLRFVRGPLRLREPPAYCAFSTLPQT